MSFSERDDRVVATIKGLAMDAVQAARSGHPGMPMGTAHAAWVMWRDFYKHDPTDPTWPDRDRFVLSAGHGSMLLYSLLHLTGYDLSLDDIKQFRQWGSKTPGHPEVGHTAGVETTTGPLGQGFANAVGMAMGERWLSERFGSDLVDHRTWCICGDGDLMEGISAEAASLAGHLKLNKLCVLYDDNRITIDGSTDLTFTEDRGRRFEAYGWHVVTVGDGHDFEEVHAALTAAVADDRPSMIVCRTHIGHSSPNFQDTNTSHGAPLGDDEIVRVKQALDFPDPSASFVVLDGVYEHGRGSTLRGRTAHRAWSERLAGHPDQAAWGTWHADTRLPDSGWPVFEAGPVLATRKSSATVLGCLLEAMPQLMGGSADLTGSNGIPKGLEPVQTDDWGGNLVHFGVREHAMGAIGNGLSLHGGVRPYNATFLAFHDYMRPAVRLSGLMKQPVIYVYTHDSVFLGEDGPTHQPVEHVMAMRQIPNLTVIRPGDANEVSMAWRAAIERTDGPTALVLTRQGLPTVDRTTHGAAEGALKGAYVLAEADGHLDLVILASGSEVSQALEARETLQQEGHGVRVVSFPSWEIFDDQDAAYKASVLPEGVKRLSVEAGRTMGWERYVGLDGAMVGWDDFGVSAPWETIRSELGLDAAAVVKAARGLLQ